PGAVVLAVDVRDVGVRVRRVAVVAVRGPDRGGGRGRATSTAPQLGGTPRGPGAGAEPGHGGFDPGRVGTCRDSAARESETETLPAGVGLVGGVDRQRGAARAHGAVATAFRGPGPGGRCLPRRVDRPVGGGARVVDGGGDPPVHPVARADGGAVGTSASGRGGQGGSGVAASGPSENGGALKEWTTRQWCA